MPVALSIKQPWATLIAHGLKTIEVRRWLTVRRGPVLIHASRSPDPRAEAWAQVPPSLLATAKKCGGIVGQAELIDCKTYATPSAFTRDRRLHLNAPAWFVPPQLFGFVFANAEPLPFRALRGTLHFFETPELVVSPPQEVQHTQLLVSVRSVAEAKAAVEGGADLIDVKDPSNGSLGAATPAVLARIVRAVAGRKPVSAALGELSAFGKPPELPELAYVKLGLACSATGWQARLNSLRRQFAPAVLVHVAYADFRKASAPSWRAVANDALRGPDHVLLLDTFDKTPQPGLFGSRPATLLDHIDLETLAELAQECRDAGVKLALAGSLRLPEIRLLLPLRPTWIAVRGAVCAANRREAAVHPLKVRALAELVHWQSPARPAS